MSFDTHIESIPSVLDVTLVQGTRGSVVPDLIIEIPHGATRTSDYTSFESVLKSPLPPHLSDFFHVNTDAGAAELGIATAKAFVERHPSRTVAVLRCLIPRTFIDCNRRIDAAPEEFKAGKVTPGLMPWITHEDDRALLLQRYGAYKRAVDNAAAEAMPEGAMLLLHTYAPRTVGVEVDLEIVTSLRKAYAPGVEETWPMRPELDVICKSEDGKNLAPPEVLTRLQREMKAVGLAVAEGESYPMHSSTLAHAHVKHWPGRVLCLEVRRDLLADPFVPFDQMSIGAEKVNRIAPGLAAAVSAWWPA